MLSFVTNGRLDVYAENTPFRGAKGDIAAHCSPPLTNGNLTTSHSLAILH